MINSENKIKRGYKIYNNGISYVFKTPQELQSFLGKRNASDFQFSIIEGQNLSDGYYKEEEILVLNIKQ